MSNLRTGSNVCDHTTEWSFSLRYGVIPRAGVELTGMPEGDKSETGVSSTVEGAKVMADELEDGRREEEEGVEPQPTERCCERVAADEREDTDNDVCVEDGAR